MNTGFVAIIGLPNVGKSTLLNAIVGEKIAITADKPQTTRNRIRGIYTDDESQIVFIDTPGVTKPRNKLGEYMADAAFGTLPDADAILFLIDRVGGEVTGSERFILQKIKDTKSPKVLVINKIDLMGPDEFRHNYESWEALGIFEDIIGTVATERLNVEDVIRALKKRMPEGPRYFPEGMVTDRPERFLAAEMIREKTLRYLNDEVPHGVAVEIEKYDEAPGVTRISAVIYTEKKSHKGIIIGKDGRKLKGIGKSAREDMERLLGTKVFLELWVKVKVGWRDSDFMLGSLGYRD
ncbi:MAG: GTPase Era [Clostridiales Family XIII bacterium]|jgi:GTP-binding protein Era|nr:GTPase Era [Clostridiales Family XIII bacterium]